jgi:hypothetical protein
MIPCTIDETVECAGPTDGRWWVCPVHGARLTKTWVSLCRTHQDYRMAWLEGNGPGQAEDSMTPRDRIERDLKNYVLSRRPIFHPTASFDDTLAWLVARPWPEILASIDCCVECEHFRGARCLRYGETCQARRVWFEELIRQPCRYLEDCPRCATR